MTRLKQAWLALCGKLEEIHIYTYGGDRLAFMVKPKIAKGKRK